MGNNHIRNKNGIICSTSYSWESFRLSLAFSSSVCSASSEMGIGGWFIIPVHQSGDRKIRSERPTGPRKTIRSQIPKVGGENGTGVGEDTKAGETMRWGLE